MRNLNIEELNEVQGGAMSTRWAFRMGDAIANMYTVYEAAGLFNFNFSSYGSASGGSYNAMGDFSNNLYSP
jgi:hypothetical protein